MQKCKKNKNKNRYAPYIFIYIIFYCFSPYSCFWQKKKTQEEQYNIIYYLSLVPRLNPFCSLFSLSCPFNNAKHIEGFAGGRRGECASKSLSSFSPPVQEAQGDLNPWAGATEGAEETQGDWRGGRRLQNAVNSDCGSQRNRLCCISNRAEPRHFPVTALESPVDAFISETPRRRQDAPNRRSSHKVVIIFALFVWFKHDK